MQVSYKKNKKEKKRASFPYFGENELGNSIIVSSMGRLIDQPRLPFIKLRGKDVRLSIPVG